MKVGGWGCVVLVLALACSSCSEAIHVRMTFRGRNIADSAGLIRVRGEKDQGRIVVESPDHGLVLPLPYGEDWEVSAAGTEASIWLHAISPSDVGLTVSLVPQEGDLVGDGQDHLRDKVFQRMQYITRMVLYRLDDVSVSPHDLGPVIRSVQIEPLEGGEDVVRGVHAITVRKSAQENLFYELGLWGFPASEPDLADLHERIVEIAGNEFRMDPPEKEDR